LRLGETMGSPLLLIKEKLTAPKWHEKGNYLKIRQKKRYLQHLRGNAS
jgi:hypothetical protein